jgi:hypothetical protein
MNAAEVQKVLDDRRERCDGLCKGWIVALTSLGPEIQLCLDCAERCDLDLLDEDVGLLPEARDELARAFFDHPGTRYGLHKFSETTCEYELGGILCGTHAAARLEKTPLECDERIWVLDDDEEGWCPECCAFIARRATAASHRARRQGPTITVESSATALAQWLAWCDPNGEWSRAGQPDGPELNADELWNAIAEMTFPDETEEGDRP